MTTLQIPTETAHTPRMDQVLSTHRTASGTSSYVRCSCGGFVVLTAERGGAWRQVSHAAAR